MTHIKLTIWFIVTGIMVYSLAGCKDKSQPSQTQADNVAQQHVNQTQNVVATTTSPSQTSKTESVSKPSLETIVAYARSWQPAFMRWYGLPAPDFTVTDINGKEHKLSKYKGKNVMLIFWATWCGPCRQEIPSLVKLREEIGDDKLAILAISYVGFRNSAETIKEFVRANPIINYTIIIADTDSMPPPYNSIYAIPTTFFINPDGTIKIVAEGVTPISHIKAILAAEK